VWLSGEASFCVDYFWLFFVSSTNGAKSIKDTTKAQPQSCMFVAMGFSPWFKWQSWSRAIEKLNRASHNLARSDKSSQIDFHLDNTQCLQVYRIWNGGIVLTFCPSPTFLIVELNSGEWPWYWKSFLWNSSAVARQKGGGVLACAEKHLFALTFFGPFLCLPARSRFGIGRSRKKEQKEKDFRALFSCKSN